MKAGYCIGIDWKKRRVEVGTEYEMMEEFMQRLGIEDSQDIYIMQSKVNVYSLRQDVAKYLRCGGCGETLCEVIFNMQQGIPAPNPAGDNPQVSTMARNTNLFEPRGPAMGDF